jgi:molecular chaperone DnaK (HSP70)
MDSDSQQKQSQAATPTEKESICIGIDLGTTNSCVGVWQDEQVHIISNDLGHNTTPSIAFYDGKTGQKIVGEMARSRLNRFPKQTFYGVKRIIGQKFRSDWHDEFHYDLTEDGDGNPLIKLPWGSSVRPEEISAQVLVKMKQIAESYLQREISKAVVTVPAYFNDGQRAATKVAARIAGLEVVRMINEPTAACLCYGLNQLSSNSHVLVFDLGGGTLDVSLLSLSEGLFEVLATSGDCHLGGEDFDLLLMNHFILREGLDLSSSQKNKLKNSCEDLKRQLSQADRGFALLEDFLPGRDDPDLSLELSVEEWNRLCEGLVTRCLEPVDQVLRDAELSEGDVDQVVLVGGSTRIRIIQESLADKFPGKRLNKSVNPDEAIAYGAAIQGAILNRQDKSGKTDQMVLVDVTPLSLGIETTGGIMSAIVPRNTSIPCEKISYYTTVENNQQEVDIKVFQGERTMTSDCRSLGTFTLTGIPAMVRGIAKIKVVFRIDADGILSIRAIEETSGTEQKVVISSDSTRLSEAEIERLVREAEQSRESDESHRRLIEQRKEISETLEDFSRMLGDPKVTGGAEEKAEMIRSELDGVRQQVRRLKEDKRDNGQEMGLLEEIRDRLKKIVLPQISGLYQAPSGQPVNDSEEIGIEELNNFLQNI